MWYNLKDAFSWGKWREEAPVVGKGLPWRLQEEEELGEEVLQGSMTVPGKVSDGGGLC